MKKAEFLKKLESGLYPFEVEYRKEIVKKYETLIDEKCSSLTEEEAVSTFGSISDLLKDIYLENHVVMQKVPQTGFWKRQVEQIFKTINHVIDVMGKNNWKANGKILLDILLLIALTCILKIPFIFVRDMGENLLLFLESPLIITIWQLVIEIIYLLVALFFFLSLFRKWFQNIKIEKS